MRALLSVFLYKALSQAINMEVRISTYTGHKHSDHSIPPVDGLF
jgi:hypothetical protein